MASVTYDFTDTFQVEVVGAKGDTGATGEAGFSPTVTITEGTDAHTISITDKSGTKTTVVKDGSNGFSPTVTITEGTSTHTISITDINGTKTTVVKDGDAETNAVKYVAQSLTDAQKTQARTNIDVCFPTVSEAETYLGIEVSE